MGVTMIKWYRKAMLRRKLGKMLDAQKLLITEVLMKEVDIKYLEEITGEWSANKYNPSWGMNKLRLDQWNQELSLMKSRVEKGDILLDAVRKELKELE